MTTNYTPEELAAMPEREFEKVVTDFLYQTRDWNSAFQHPDVIHRTAAALVSVLGVTDRRIRERREDPDYTSEQLRGIDNFRDHLLVVIESTDRRIASLSRGTYRDIQRWKDFAHSLCDIIEDSSLAAELDQETEPFGTTARQWLDRRRIKDPSRVKAAAA